ncbi:aminopeptidase-like protein, partial [Leptotrombidium deliense]
DYLSDSSDEQPLNMAIKNTGQLLKKLRDLMKNSNYVSEAIQAYIIPSFDAHQSEYISNSDRRLAFISGFTGSAGTVVITLDDAALWTDGRYFLQAEKQLGQNWTLMRDGLPDTPSQSEWLNKVLPNGSRVGVDGMILAQSQWQPLSQQLESGGNQLVAVAQNLIDVIWEDRPAPPAAPIFPLPLSYSGETWQKKIGYVRDEMKKKKASAVVLSALDETAWLFNLRGSDIDFNPVFYAYTVITLDNVYLFVDEMKLTAESLKHLHLNNSPCQENGLSVELRPYKIILDFLKWYVSQNTGKIWVSNQSSHSLVTLIPETRRISDSNPVLIKKTMKNDIEVERMRLAHIKDAVALCEFYAWLEDQVTKGGDVTELIAVDKLEEIRKSQEDYVGPSFETILASGPNAAVIHYKPTEDTNRQLTTSEIILCDCGVQFKDGTTDVTRTLHFGTPSDFEKECYTRVVKGHIALALAIFPKLAKGTSLDSYARKPLWDVGLDYRHGTGHGVGVFLNVHEGPIGISPRQRPNDIGLQEGMILSNEPGYYEDGKFGIRIESLVLVKKAETKYNFGDTNFLKFDTITLVPIQTKLLDPSLLTSEEIEWLDNYHQQCREVIGKELKEQGRTHGYQWLLKETQPLG